MAFFNFINSKNNYITVILLTTIPNTNWLYTLDKKSDLKQLIQNFEVLMESNSNTKILSLYTSSGAEYKIIDSCLRTQGIEHLLASSYTPQRVALAEHRYIIETEWTLLHEASLPPTLRSFACQHMVYIINSLPTLLLQNQSPFHILYGKHLDYAQLKILGACVIYDSSHTRSIN